MKTKYWELLLAWGVLAEIFCKFGIVDGRNCRICLHEELFHLRRPGRSTGAIESRLWHIAPLLWSNHLFFTLE